LRKYYIPGSSNRFNQALIVKTEFASKITFLLNERCIEITDGDWIAGMPRVHGDANVVVTVKYSPRMKAIGKMMKWESTNPKLTPPTRGRPIPQ
jgi:hypothetical protein